MQHAASISAEEQSIKMAQYAAVTAGGDGGSEKLWDISVNYFYTATTTSMSVLMMAETIYLQLIKTL